MGVFYQESYKAGRIYGELIYELMGNSRVPFILASEAPDHPWTHKVKGLSGTFSIGMDGNDQSNFVHWLWQQGKLERDIESIYGKAGELMIGGYNELLFNKTDLFWVNTTGDYWTLDVKKVSYDHKEYKKEGLKVQIVLEVESLALPEPMYNEIFNAANLAGCKETTDMIECNTTPEKIKDFPRFVVWFTDDKYIVIHPEAYMRQIEGTRYEVNAYKTVDWFFLGGAVLNNVYVIFDSQAKKVGFVNYDQDTDNNADAEITSTMMILLIIAAVATLATLIVGIIYCITRKKDNTEDAESMLIQASE